MRALFYIDQDQTPEGTTCLRYSDLVAWKQPACVMPGEGAVLLGLRYDIQDGHPRSRWHVESVNGILDRDEDGDSIALHLASTVDDQARSLLRTPLVRWKLMSEYHWIPSPMNFPQPVPRSLWQLFYASGNKDVAA